MCVCVCDSFNLNFLRTQNFLFWLQIGCLSYFLNLKHRAALALRTLDAFLQYFSCTKFVFFFLSFNFRDLCTCYLRNIYSLLFFHVSQFLGLFQVKAAIFLHVKTPHNSLLLFPHFSFHAILASHINFAFFGNRVHREIFFFLLNFNDTKILCKN